MKRNEALALGISSTVALPRGGFLLAAPPLFKILDHAALGAAMAIAWALTLPIVHLLSERSLQALLRVEGLDAGYFSADAPNCSRPRTCALRLEALQVEGIAG